MVRRHYGIRTKRHKLIHYYEIGEWELFDLESDPDELRSVYEDPAYQEAVEELKVRLDALRSQYQVPAQDPVPYRSWPPPS
jgi:arylsulfatase A-like enzyme